MIHDFASSSSCKSLPSAEAAQNFQRRAVGEVCKETATKLTRDPQIFMWPAGWSHPGAHCWYVTASTWKTMDSWRFLGAAFFSRDKNLWVSRNPKEFLSDSDGRGCCWRLHLMMCLWPSELPRWFMQSSDPRRCFQCLVYDGPACPSKVWLGWFASPFLQDVVAWHGGKQRIWPTLMEQDSDRWKPATLSKGIVPGPQVDGRQSWWRKLQLWNLRSDYHWTLGKEFAGMVVLKLALTEAWDRCCEDRLCWDLCQATDKWCNRHVDMVDTVIFEQRFPVQAWLSFMNHGRVRRSSSWPCSLSNSGASLVGAPRGGFSDDQIAKILPNYFGENWTNFNLEPQNNQF